MSLPAKWNPVAVTVTHVDVAATPIDPVFKNPVNRKARPTSTNYQAQVNFGLKIDEKRFRTLMGDRPITKARSRIVLRSCDLAPNTVLEIPKKGDKITALYVGTPAELAVDYLIEEVRPESPLNGVPLLWYVEFERDRERV